LPKIKEVKGMRTRGARGGSKLCRTLDAKPCHRLASLGNPKKKNVLSIFRKNSPRAKSEKQGTFFFLGFCLPSIQAVWRGFNSDSVLRKLFFLGIWIFAKPRLICFWILSARRRGLGRNPRGLLDFVFGGLFFPIFDNQVSAFEFNFEFLFFFPFQFPHIFNRQSYGKTIASGNFGKFADVMIL